MHRLTKNIVVETGFQWASKDPPSDTKTGQAGVIGAVKAIIESGIQFKGKIILLFATEGEGSAAGGPDSLLEHNLLSKADGAIHADASDRKIVNTFKGRMLLEFVTHGKSVHSSNPMLGVNYPAAELRGNLLHKGTICSFRPLDYENLFGHAAYPVITTDSPHLVGLKTYHHGFLPHQTCFSFSVSDAQKES